jgi:hypothetical protein
MPDPDISELPVGSDAIVRPFERVRFANGLEATLQDDGTLRIMSTARGLRGITIYPSSDNSCRIGVIGEMYRKNVKGMAPGSAVPDSESKNKPDR